MAAVIQRVTAIFAFATHQPAAPVHAVTYRTEPKRGNAADRILMPLILRGLRCPRARVFRWLVVVVWRRVSAWFLSSGWRSGWILRKGPVSSCGGKNKVRRWNYHGRTCLFPLNTCKVKTSNNMPQSTCRCSSVFHCLQMQPITHL